MTVEITGVCPDRFARVRDVFEANFEKDTPWGGELGARFAFAIDGEVARTGRETKPPIVGTIWVLSF